MKIKLGILIMVAFSPYANEIHSQKLNEQYFGIVSKKSSSNHYLEFKNDSIVELIPMNRHMQRSFTKSFLFTRNTDTVIINIYSNPNKDTESSNQHHFFHFTENIMLTIDGKVLMDKRNKVIYLLSDDVKKNNHTTFIIDGEEFLQENLMNDSYGFFNGNTKKNTKLKRKLEAIKSDLKDQEYDIFIYTGIDAYLKFGYEKALGGVVELIKK